MGSRQIWHGAHFADVINWTIFSNRFKEFDSVGVKIRPLPLTRSVAVSTCCATKSPVIVNELI